MLWFLIFLSFVLVMVVELISVLFKVIGMNWFGVIFLVLYMICNIFLFIFI